MRGSFCEILNVVILTLESILTLLILTLLILTLESNNLEQKNNKFNPKSKIKKIMYIHFIQIQISEVCSGGCYGGSFPPLKSPVKTN